MFLKHSDGHIKSFLVFNKNRLSDMVPTFVVVEFPSKGQPNEVISGHLKWTIALFLSFRLNHFVLRKHVKILNQQFSN